MLYPVLFFISVDLVAQTEFNVTKKGDYYCTSDSNGIAHLLKIENDSIKEVGLVITLKKWKRKLRKLKNKLLESDDKISLEARIDQLEDEIVAVQDCMGLNDMSSACNNIAANASSHNNHIALPIIAGENCNNSNSPVVEILLKDPYDSILGSCTGTVLNSNTVISAAHCFVNQFSISSVEIVTTTGNSYFSEEFYAHPDYSPSNKRPQHDIAIIRTNSNIDTNNIQIANSNDITQNEILTIAGYGDNENEESGILRAGYTSIFQFNKNFILVRYLPGSGSGGCHGDSGGPVLIYRNNTWQLLGVISGGTANCGLNGQTSYGIFINLTLPSHKNFIYGLAPELES